MLFTSYPFLFAFLPLALVLVLGLSAIGQRPFAKLALFVASLCFYGWWSQRYVPLLLGLVALNYGVARALLATRESSARWRSLLLWAGIAMNLGALGYYKYTNFFLDTVSLATHRDLRIPAILLPLGLSFIVFQKIGLLVDVHSGAIDRLPLVDYALFVTFFPQLIAGPIVHHRELIPQFEDARSLRFSWRSVTAGLAFFTVGAFKKVAIADTLAPHASALFINADAHGEGVGAVAAWIGSLAYALQLYFDFSGYSDMSMGLAALFNIRLPPNFDSPYKATSIIDYWRRWHMSLTRFLTAYIYNPVALAVARRRAAAGKRSPALAWGTFMAQLAWPTLLTMTLAGIWHGAGWQFLVFGVLHGIYLTVNHAWILVRKKRKWKSETPSLWTTVMARTLTFVSVVLGLVFFRATSVRSALHVVAAMVGAHGLWSPLTTTGSVLAFMFLTFTWTQAMPNTVEWIGPVQGENGDGDPAERSLFAWRPGLTTGLALGAAAVYVLTAIARPVPFLYFRF